MSTASVSRMRIVATALVVLVPLGAWQLAGSIGLGAAYACLSLIALAAYRRDKLAALSATRRTSEAKLHAIDLAGGWPGGLLAQQLFRHKTRKTSFQLGFWLTVVLNIAAVAYLAPTLLAHS